MSKMIKLLNKNKVSSSDLYGGNAGLPQAGQASAHEDINYKDNTTLYRVSLSLMAFVAVIAVTSLIVSYKAFNQMKASHDLSVRLTNINSQQQGKIESLETELFQLVSSESRRLDDLNHTLQGLRKTVALNQDSMQEILLKHNTLKAAVEKLKGNDSALLSKFLVLNNDVIELEKNLNSEGKGN